MVYTTICQRCKGYSGAGLASHDMRLCYINVIQLMMAQCWASSADGGPALKQYWVNVHRLWCLSVVPVVTTRVIFNIFKRHGKIYALYT